ncbi:MAG: hypothetical protein OXM54_01635 [Acidimicrobiaceae bacterium]|nr:hypothetical protein [Acidimicrobiaceae bacterium]
MSTNTETPATPRLRDNARFWTAAFIVTVVAFNVAEWVTDWPRWWATAPAAIIAVGFLSYGWAKYHRRVAAAGGSGS